MPTSSTTQYHRSQGYPSESHVRRGCAAISSAPPDVVYRTCCVRLHNVSQRNRAALLEVFKNNTLAAAWMLRDIERRNPLARFAVYRKSNSSSFNTRGIAVDLGRAYRSTIRARYALNVHLFDGLCTTVAAMLAGWLQNMTEALQQGHLQRYKECASYIMPVGKHAKKALGSLGRKTIYGYAFLMPTVDQYKEALYYLNVLINRHSEDVAFQPVAENYLMPSGPHQGRTLGTMQRQTLQRLRLLVVRDIEHADQFEHVRGYAKDYLRYTPPAFPSIVSNGLTIDRQLILAGEYLASLDTFGALPDVLNTEEDESWLTEDEHSRFQHLQHAAYAITHKPLYVPLRWNRADAFSKGRDMGVGYEAERGRYVLLLHVLAHSSRYRRPLDVKRTIIDVNNPTIVLKSRKRPSIGMLFEIDCDNSRKAMLDQARQEAELWKAGTSTSGGCIRAATLHAHIGDNDQSWFEAQIAVGTKPESFNSLENVIGVHIDLESGVFLSIHQLDGACLNQFQLDAARIARLLRNKDPERQALLAADQRTAKERQHRLADALVAICVQYRAALGVEDVSYRWRPDRRAQARFHELSESSRSVVELLDYKLPLANLPPVVDIRGVAPNRDCGACGARQVEARDRPDIFTCSECGHSEARYLNAAREVARRTLWILALKKS